MRLLLIADTHCRAAPGPADAVSTTVHSLTHTPRLEARLRAGSGWWCGGHQRRPELQARLPEVARVDLDGLRLAVVHETGAATGRERRCDQQFPDTDVLVFGHSHIPWDTTTVQGMRLLNPGSPTDRRRQPDHTYLTASVAAGQLSQVRLHRLPRGTPGA